MTGVGDPNNLVKMGATTPYIMGAFQGLGLKFESYQAAGLRSITVFQQA